MAATSLWIRALRWAASLVGGVLATGAAKAVDLPEERAEAMVHIYDGGGVKASGPALLVRKNMADRVSVQASYYLDMVSNASIDVVTTASPYKEKRSEYGFGVDYAYRDTLITLSTASSREPDYTANSVSLDMSQETFGGMTTVSLGFTRGSDKVLKHASPDFADRVTHWQYRFGVTQVLTPKVLASANFEALADDGYLGSPYRVARVFGAAVPERNPRTRSARAVKFRVIGEVAPRQSVHADYRYFWDNWGIKAHTTEFGYSRYFGEAWLADGFLRFYNQKHALFYSDNAATETLYVSRNRQLSSFNDISIGGKLSYKVKQVPSKYDVKLNGSYEYIRFRYSDFTDVRTGSPYSYAANVLQLFVTANF